MASYYNSGGTPSGKNIYNNQQGFQLVDVAKNLINQRKEKLEYEKMMLQKVGNQYPGGKGGKKNDISSLYNLQSIIKGKNMMNPNLYSYQYIDPIYYPMEMPTNGEPMTLPKVEMGQPMHDPMECHCCGGEGEGLGLADLLGLLRPKKKKEVEQPVYKPITPMKTPKRTPEPKKKEEPKKEEVGFTGKKKDWWRIARAWVNMGKFYFVSHKYGKFSNTRNELINKSSQALPGYQDTLINWFNTFLTDFYNEFREIPDMNLMFTNYSGKLKIQEQSQKINALLNIFFNCLLNNASDLKKIPNKIQQVIYTYIKEKAYFSPKSLSTFEVNRLDFNFYGGIKNHTDESIGMILALFLFSKTLVKRILLRIKDFVPDFKTFRHIDVSMKMIGSIIHYLVRDTFKGRPPLTKDVLALLNYYRNYHIDNKDLSKTTDVLNNNITYKDIDETAQDLFPEGLITSYFQTNVNQVEQFQNIIYRYAIGFGRKIRQKFAAEDNNLKNSNR